MTTRSPVNAAVPQQPLLGPTGQGAKAAVTVGGKFGPARGNS